MERDNIGQDRTGQDRIVNGEGQYMTGQDRIKCNMVKKPIDISIITQAYYSLSTAPQDSYCCQVGGRIEDLSTEHSLRVPDDQTFTRSTNSPIQQYFFQPTSFSLYHTSFR